MLELIDVTAGYTTPVVQAVSLRAERGCVTGILGPNGAGKTTLLRAIAGWIPVSQGRVLIDGTDVTSVAPYARWKAGIAYVPEDRRLFRDLTVLENLRSGLVAVGIRGAARSAAVDKILAFFPRLREREQQRAGSLSGGEQQMVAIGRALVAEPRVLILDEPSLGLAPRVVDELFAKLREIAASGISIILVEQNAALGLGSTSYGYLLAQGRIVAEGASADLAGDARVRQVYFGA